MKIGIMGAMTEEVLRLKSLMSTEMPEVRGGREYLSGKLKGHTVVVVFSRWGKVAAASTATTLIEKFDVDFLIFTGVAGALDSSLEIGDIVVADRLVQHDMDASALPGIKPYEIPLLGIQYFDIDPDLVRKARISAETYVARDLNRDIPSETLRDFYIESPKAVNGLIASGDQFIASGEKALQLRTAFPSIKCVEMEGAAVAQVAYENDCPLVVIRTISDKADHSAIVDFPKFVKNIASHFTCGSVIRLLDRL